MKVATWGTLPITVGSIIALIVLILAILGIAGAFPFTTVVVFAFIAALALARLL